MKIKYITMMALTVASLSLFSCGGGDSSSGDDTSSGSGDSNSTSAVWPEEIDSISSLVAGYGDPNFYLTIGSTVGDKVYLAYVNSGATVPFEDVTYDKISDTELRIQGVQTFPDAANDPEHSFDITMTILEDNQLDVVGTFSRPSSTAPFDDVVFDVSGVYGITLFGVPGYSFQDFSGFELPELE